MAVPGGVRIDEDLFGVRTVAIRNENRVSRWIASSMKDHSVSVRRPTYDYGLKERSRRAAQHRYQSNGSSAVRIGMEVPRTQISEPSPENPMLHVTSSRSLSLPCVRFWNRPVPTCPANRLNEPSRSERKATNLPSGEMSAANSDPSKSVTRVKTALASGFAGAAPSVRRGTNRVTASRMTRPWQCQ